MKLSFVTCPELANSSQLVSTYLLVHFIFVNNENRKIEINKTLNTRVSMLSYVFSQLKSFKRQGTVFVSTFYPNIFQWYPINACLHSVAEVSLSQTSLSHIEISAFSISIEKRAAPWLVWLSGLSVGL